MAGPPIKQKVQAAAKSNGNSGSGSAKKSSSTSAPNQSTSSAKPGNTGRGGDTDGAAEGESEFFNKRLDLAFAHSTLVMKGGFKIPPRPALSTTGTAQKVALNCFEVASFPTDAKKINQFDLVFTSEDNKEMKRGLMMKLWNSSPVQQKFKNFLWDGNKLAWSHESLRHSEVIEIDLDAEGGRAPKAGKSNKHKVHIRQVATIDLTTMYTYLSGKCSFDEKVLQALNFFDHLLRATPAKNLVQLKRSFFLRGNNWKALGGGVEAWKGVYQSIRIAHVIRNGANLGRLMINADVANGMFFETSKLTNMALVLTGYRDLNQLSNALTTPSIIDMKAMNRLRKIRVLAHHRGSNNVDEYVIDRFIYKDAKSHIIDVKGPDGNPTKISVYDYFGKKYNVRLAYPKLPLVANSKNSVLPMEILLIKSNQRYPFKLDERQTSEMIKFAATPPQERLQSIQNGLSMLNWGQDPMLAKYGVKINPTKVIVDARLLPPPTVKFANGEAKPGTSGRWDLKGKKFVTGNPVPLKSWAVCAVTNGRGKAEKAVVDNFVRALISAYIQHGGQVVEKNPYTYVGTVRPGKRTADGKLDDGVSEMVMEGWNKAGNQAQARPQMMVFILPDKNAQIYNRIKRSTDCRFGVVSQCVQYSHAQKAAPQYLSNVCMKFNAKLGGVNCYANAPATARNPGGALLKPTIIIGADVSHAAPGAQTPSMAAVTMSQDARATRYAAQVETNGFRVEMILEKNIEKLIKPMLLNWLRGNGGKLPERVIYLRDGVSESQYAHVLDQEVRNMKIVLKDMGPGGDKVKFLVAVGSKRHHVRFFPQHGDRNGNPLPGTLVETGVTHPFENDFYLCSHAAIKGTARPMHYHVLLNEIEMDNKELQTMIYEHCYQFQRATTPISQHPAIYYAHIASNRAVGHDPKYGDLPTSDDKNSKDHKTDKTDKISDPLLVMPDQANFPQSMWFI